MTREEKIKTLLDVYMKEGTIKIGCEAINMGYKSASTYLKVLIDYGMLKQETRKTINGRPVYFFQTLDSNLTMDLYEKISNSIAFEFKESKRRYKESKKVGIYEKNEVNIEQEEQAKKDESKGIYLLSSKPSRHFVEKLKQTDEIRRKDFKSPKNYAGTSEGLLW